MGYVLVYTGDLLSAALFERLVPRLLKELLTSSEAKKTGPRRSSTGYLQLPNAAAFFYSSRMIFTILALGNGLDKA